MASCRHRFLNLDLSGNYAPPLILKRCETSVSSSCHHCVGSIRVWSLGCEKLSGLRVLRGLIEFFCGLGWFFSYGFAVSCRPQCPHSLPRVYAQWKKMSIWEARNRSGKVKKRWVSNMKIGEYPLPLGNEPSVLSVLNPQRYRFAGIYQPFRFSFLEIIDLA